MAGREGAEKAGMEKGIRIENEKGGRGGYGLIQEMGWGIGSVIILMGHSMLSPQETSNAQTNPLTEEKVKAQKNIALLYKPERHIHPSSNAGYPFNCKMLVSFLRYTCALGISNNKGNGHPLPITLLSPLHNDREHKATHEFSHPI